uniref:ABC transporter domain-containing protein n=1 Tax=Sciurus vulgaris TaxID=55149 RepID=A0A8D2CWZ3_SCIVU
MASGNDQICIPMSQRNTNGLKTFPERAVLSFHDICYRVKVKSGFLPVQNKEELEILSDINGIMKPGLNAIMGPTGGGKSFLLDILAARKDPCGLSGEVLINGAPQHANFPCETGYVVQDDVVMGTLTVRENLQFSAALRLPTTMTNHEKNERINKVIQDLGLSKVADFKVGTQFMWGVSGGERKRTHIAMELITDPPILFLDEPTTGLDSSTASAVLLLLKRISEQGRTIIFSIHQPQYSIFKLFDRLTLLASGKLIFHGPAQEALGYFESIGYPCEPYNNPADFFLDVISGDSSAVGLNREEEDCEASETEQLSQREKSVIETLVECYANSSFCRDTKAELDELSGGQKKKRSLALKEITYILFIGHLSPFCPCRAGLLLVMMVCECFSSVLAGQIFVVEKKLFIHEYISGYYRLLSYFFGKLLFDLLPRKLLPSIIFSCIIYIMAELKPEAGAFFIMIVTVTVVAYSASSMALAMATDQSLHYVLTLLMNLYFVFMMVLLVISLYFGTIPPWLSWIQYFSIPHYGFKNLTNTMNVIFFVFYFRCTGEEFLTIQGMDLSPWGLWQNYVGLAVLMIFFLTITYLKLLFLKKYS